MTTHYDAHGPRTVTRKCVEQDAIRVVLEMVHPGNLGPLPPSLPTLIQKGRSLGLLLPTDIYEVRVWARWWDAQTQAAQDHALQRRHYLIH